MGEWLNEGVAVNILYILHVAKGVLNEGVAE